MRALTTLFCLAVLSALAGCDKPLLVRECFGVTFRTHLRFDPAVQGPEQSAQLYQDAGGGGFYLGTLDEPRAIALAPGAEKRECP